MSNETLLSRAIPDSEIEEDIAQTQAEIQAIEKTISMAEKSIRERREFIGKLRALLDERGLARSHAAPNES